MKSDILYYGQFPRLHTKESTEDIYFAITWARFLYLVGYDKHCVSLLSVTYQNHGTMIMGTKLLIGWVQLVLHNGRGHAFRMGTAVKKYET